MFCYDIYQFISYDITHIFIFILNECYFINPMNSESTVDNMDTMKLHYNSTMQMYRLIRFSILNRIVFQLDLITRICNFNHAV